MKEKIVYGRILTFDQTVILIVYGSGELNIVCSHTYCLVDS